MRAFITHSFFLFLFFIYRAEAQSQYFTDIDVPGFPYGVDIPAIGINSQGIIYSQWTNNSKMEIYRSMNFGESWQLVQCPQNCSTNFRLVYGANDILYYTRSGGETYVSSDNGDNWTLVNALTPVSIYFATKNGILVGKNEDKIYVSFDNGAIWVQRTIPLSITNSNVLYNDGVSDVIYFFFQNELYRSIDLGNTWTLVFDNSQSLPYFDGISNVFVNTYNGAIYIASGINNFNNFYVSFDDGLTWEHQPLISQSNYLSFSETGRIYKSNGYYSDDDGQTWFPLDSAPGPNFRKVYAVPGAKAFAVRNGFVYSLDNGDTWNFSMTGILFGSPLSWAHDSAGNLFAATRQGVFRSDDEGQNWEAVYSHTSAQFSGGYDIYTGPSNEVYLTLSNGVARSVDNGNNFEIISQFPDQLNCMSFHPAGITFICYEDGFFKSEDSGETWIPILPYTSARQMAIHENGDIFCDVSLSWSNPAWVKSSDAGLTWEILPIPNPEDYDFIEITNDGCIWLFSSTYAPFLKSCDNGATWQSMPLNGIPSDPDDLRNVVTNAVGHVFVQFGNSNASIYFTIDGGLSWSPLPGNEEIGYALSLYIAPSQVLYAGSLTHGALRSISPTVDLAYLSGKLRFDEDENCLIGLTDTTLLAGWTVKATGDYTTYANTNAEGEYLLPALFGGDFEVQVVPPTALWGLCDPISISINAQNYQDTITLPDLLVQPEAICPLLEVNIASPLIRRCFDGYYSVHYCNNGTAPAENAYLELQMDDFLELTSAELPIASQNGQTHTFQLGNLGIGECGDFKVYFNVSCDAALGQTHCTEAHVFPDSICGNHPGWSGGMIELEGNCVGGLILFSVTNTGTAALDALPFTLIKDGQIVQQDYLGFMAPGETLGVNWPADGDYFSIQVDNPPGYPYPGKKASFVENCGGQGTGSWFAGSLPLGDTEPFIAIDCQENIGSFDPNDKAAFPVGFGDEHFIERNTNIDYRIRFQNTGTDTAFNVVIVDTLSAWLDPATIRTGAASHAYEMGLSGNDQDGVVLKFRFPDIMLPDSNINEPASHGFIQFSVSQKADNPLGTIIENNAGIYFDFNEPVVTNTVWHEVGENFIVINDVETLVKSIAPSIAISPNPTTGEAVLKLQSPPSGILEMWLMDARGRLLQTEQFTGSERRIYLSEFPTGLYFVKLISEKGWSATAKFMKVGK
jgi:uncharacterized repeat protein (TIGR01451 family)